MQSLPAPASYSEVQICSNLWTWLFLDLVIMRNNLYLHPHPLQTQLLYPNQRAYRLMIRHPLLEVCEQDRERLFVDLGQVCRHTKYLRPALSTGWFEGEFHVFEGLVKLVWKIGVYLASDRVPTTCVGLQKSGRAGAVVCTLTRALYTVPDSHSLGIPHLLSAGFSPAFVGVVL